jgi:heat shock protein HslJ
MGGQAVLARDETVDNERDGNAPKGEPMNGTRVIRTLLGAALVVAIPTLAAAQADGRTPDGREWHLNSYTDHGELHDVPADVSVTLPLASGQVYGSAGCQGYEADYEIDDDALTFSNVALTSEVGCPDQAAPVEADYMSLLPTTAGWRFDTGPRPGTDRLILFDEAGDPILEFVEPRVGTNFAAIRALTDLVNAQQRQIDRLTRQVAALRRQVGE